MSQTVGKWAQKREARRLEILEVAQALLIANGVEALSMHRLAKAMSCTPGALYRYFDSRDGILMTLQVQNLEELHEVFTLGVAASLEARELDAGDAALISVLAYATMYSALPTTLPERFRLIMLVIGDTKLLVEDEQVLPALAVTMRLLGDVAQYLGSAAQAGALSEGSDIRRAFALWTCVHGVTTASKMARFPDIAPFFDGLAVENTSDLLLSWGAKPAHVTRCRELLVEHGSGPALLEEAWRRRTM